MTLEWTDADKRLIRALQKVERDFDRLARRIADVSPETASPRKPFHKRRAIALLQSPILKAVDLIRSQCIT